jgi:hypothetical protein
VKDLAGKTMSGNENVTDMPGGRVLPPEALRALAEAAERRRQAEAKAAKPSQPKELGGPKGPEPTRYGDWERKGILSDF